MEEYSTDLLRALIDGVECSVAVFDQDLHILAWNKSMERRCGQRLEDCRGRPMLAVFPQADTPKFRRTIDLARTESRHVYDHWIESVPFVWAADGAGTAGMPAYQSTVFFPFERVDGQACFGLMVFDSDAVASSCDQLQSALSEIGSRQTEQEQLLRKLETANNQLMQSEKLAAIGQLAAGVAHEINNPIGFVFSNLKTLGGYMVELISLVDAIDRAGDIEELRRLKSDMDYDYIRGDVEAVITESEDGIDRVKKIISALKDFSHIDEEEFRPADLHKGLETTLNVVNNELKYKAEVVKEYGDLPEVECIQSQINQVMMNLLINAAHAMDEFGRITLRSGHENDWVWLEVEDTGKGIEPKTLNRIFEPFFTTKPVGKGTGLGLALSYSIVQKHHGRIDVRSVVGKGTVFRVWLPVAQPAAANVANTASA